MAEEERRKLLELIDAKDKKILDVGCGDGRYSEVFSKSCEKYIGLDVDPVIIEENKKNNKLENVFYECCDIIEYTPQETFDFIILSLAFHEIDIKEQGIALMKMLDLLNKNGQLIIIDPRLETDSFQGFWNVAYENLKFFDHNFVVKHSENVIQKAVEKNLCKIMKKDQLDVKFTFQNINELIEMIKEDVEFEKINWQDKKVYEDFEMCLRDFIKDENKIILYDKLNITVLRRME